MSALCVRCPPISTGHVAFLVSALFRWPCSISIHVSPRSVTLVVSALFCRSCSISIHLSPRSVTAGVRPFSLAMRHLYSFVSQVFSAGHVTVLFICFPGLSLVVSTLFSWRCNISIHLSPRSVTAGVRPFPLAMQHFYSYSFPKQFAFTQGF